MLIVFAGLPGAGTTTLARELAAQYLRTDSIDQALRDSGVVLGSLDDAGYRAAHPVAADNLRLGRAVIPDSVNPWTRTPLVIDTVDGSVPECIAQIRAALESGRHG